MKQLLLVLGLILSFQLSAQTQDFIGTYERKSTSDDGTIEWELILNEDGTFTFCFDKNLKSHLKADRCIEGSDSKNYQAARGIWTSKKNYIYFHADENDINDTYNLNFNNFKASYKSKHPRDKSDRVIKPHIIFSVASIFWIKNLKLHKKESTITTDKH